MENLEGDPADSALFNEQVLLALFEGKRDDATVLLDVAIMEMRLILEKMRRHIKARDFGGMLLDAVNAQGMAGAMASQTIAEFAARAVRMAILRKAGEVWMSCRDMEDTLTQFEAHLKGKDWQIS